MVALNDFRSSYIDVLTTLGIMTIYKQVLHKRILLGRSYARHSSYLPPGTVRHLNPRQRRRFHDFAHTATDPTSLETRDSALEECLLAWNRVSSDLSKKSYNALKINLKSTKYSDRVVEPIGMLEAVLML